MTDAAQPYELLHVSLPPPTCTVGEGTYRLAVQTQSFRRSFVGVFWKSASFLKE